MVIDCTLRLASFHKTDLPSETLMAIEENNPLMELLDSLPITLSDQQSNGEYSFPPSLKILDSILVASLFEVVLGHEGEVELVISSPKIIGDRLNFSHPQSLDLHKAYYCYPSLSLGFYNIHFLLSKSKLHVAKHLLPDIMSSLQNPTSDSLYLPYIERHLFDFTSDNVIPIQAMEMHDSIFHAASSFGFGTNEVYGVNPPKPGLFDQDRSENVAERDHFGRISLASSNILAQRDYRDVVRQRRSRRDFSESPLSVEVLSTFFDLTLRLETSVLSSDGDYAYYFPYLGAGARGEITTLVLLNQNYPEPGLYEYRPMNHDLINLSASIALRQEIMCIIRSALCLGNSPRMAELSLIYISDYQRMAGRYGTIAYANMLRDIGCVYQTVAFACEYLNLNSCPMGGYFGKIDEVLKPNVIKSNHMVLGTTVVGNPI